MPPDMALDMRRTKLKAEEAALLAGELTKPSWESRNEGIHERVSFEDAIWGFDLAGGSYYKTPLRVVGVKPNSRAEKAGIRPGDRLKRINDIDTSTLTIQEAHEIIIKSGIHLKLAVTAPEDEEDAYYCYEDPVEEGYDSDEERRKEEEKARRREVHAKVSSYWSLKWPWVSKRRVIYRESNCFMVPSKYENKHVDKFIPQPILKTQEDIILESAQREKERKVAELMKPKEKKKEDEPVVNDNQSILNKTKNNNLGNSTVSNANVNGVDSNINGNLDPISEIADDSIQEDVTNSLADDLNEISKSDEVTNSRSDEVINSQSENIVDSKSDEVINSQSNEIIQSQNEEMTNSQSDELTNSQSDLTDESTNNEVSNTNEDEIIKEVLDENEENVSKVEEDNIIDSILSGEHSIDNSESIDER